MNQQSSHLKTPVIDVKGLGNRFGSHWVHKDLDFTVYPGEILAIVGGSGCGKTTLLRSIILLHRPTVGEVSVFNKNVLSLSGSEAGAMCRRWGMLFQHGALFSSLTVLENILFPLNEFTQLPKKLATEIALLKIHLAGLEAEAAHLYPSELSGGMLKRAALARSIALDPELLFLDEPTAGLDPNSADAFDDLLLQLKDTLNLTVVMVTHDLDTLWRVTDRVAFLGEGKNLATLPMEALSQDPHPMIQSYFHGPRGQQRIELNELRSLSTTSHPDEPENE